MPIEIGHVAAIFRYPVRSMGGERLEVARLALRRMEDRSGLPWLTASKLPDLLLFAPQRCKDGAQEVVRANQNNAGIYGRVTRTGELAVGQSIFHSRGVLAAR